MPSSNHPSRRTVLATGAAFLTASLAGCGFSRGTAKGATDVVVYNEADDAKSVAVTIADADADQPRLETTVSLGRGERATPTASDKLPVGTDYTVEIDVEQGPTETYHWPDVSLELAPLHVILSCRSEIYFELQSSSR